MTLYLDSAALLVLGSDGPEREPWFDWVSARIQAEDRFCTSVLALLEVERYFARYGRPEMLGQFFHDLGDLTETVLPLTRDDLLRGYDLSRVHELPSWIGVQAAVALANGIEVIVSPDQRYRLIPGLALSGP